MKVLILGIDGYIGWPLANHLEGLGHKIIGVDNLSRRMNAESLIQIETDRIEKFEVIYDDIATLKYLPKVDAIIHLAEQPSASWSMRSSLSAMSTQYDNVIGTLNLLWLMKRDCPNAHLIKLGSMGEYGTPNCEIPEGFIEDGSMKGLMFPRTPNSFYHLSKVFDSMNIDFACKTWGLRSTDIMQGVVFGIGGRFDYDEHFGTVINRFCVQAVAGMPLTVYGTGGQKRAFLPLKDSIECLTRVLDNPSKGYRVFNQFAETYTIKEIAESVQSIAYEFGLNVTIHNLDNIRNESENHFFEPKHDNLKKLGYNPNWKIQDELRGIIATLIPYKDKIDKSIILPKTKWNETKRNNSCQKRNGTTCCNNTQFDRRTATC